MFVNPIHHINNQRILLSPLNWGLGHVTRTISVIRQLRKQNCDVIICCDEVQERFYRNYFEDIWYVSHAGYPFKFRGKGKWISDLAKNMGELNAFRKMELIRTGQLVRDFQPDLLVSDQRFGFRNVEVKSVIVSHQLSYRLPVYASFSNVLNRRQLERFDEVWIPDVPGHALSGDLSKSSLKHTQFIGWQSRFLYTGVSSKHTKSIDFLCIVSGPEPYAHQFYLELLTLFTDYLGVVVIVVPSKAISSTMRRIGRCQVLVNPSETAFEDLFHSAKKVISRAGYSTLMDLSVMGNDALLVPTPGQSEQLYLAHHHRNHASWKFELNANNLIF